MTIEHSWIELENDVSFSAGLYYRRPSAEMVPNLYIGLRLPEKHRCLAIELDRSLVKNFAEYNTLREIRLEPYVDPSGKSFLLILLVDSVQKDIFTVLCEDLIRTVQPINVPQEVVSNLIVRIQQWQMLFDKLKIAGLSELSQIGLYGELTFLRRILQSSDKRESLVRFWVGPQGANQDFSFPNCAVEVKTTHGKNHQKIHISNERQLDTSTIPRLYLYHISVDVRVNNGETLNECIDDLISLLFSDPIALSIFRLQLSSIGYFDVHRELYSTTGYEIRHERAFKVDGDFPRIIEANVPSGVGDVQYTIIIPDDTPWNVSTDDLMAFIKV